MDYITLNANINYQHTIGSALTSEAQNTSQTDRKKRIDRAVYVLRVIAKPKFCDHGCEVQSNLKLTYDKQGTLANCVICRYEGENKKILKWHNNSEYELAFITAEPQDPNHCDIDFSRKCAEYVLMPKNYRDDSCRMLTFPVHLDAKLIHICNSNGILKLKTPPSKVNIVGISDHCVIDTTLVGNIFSKIREDYEASGESIYTIQVSPDLAREIIEYAQRSEDQELSSLHDIINNKIHVNFVSYSSASMFSQVNIVDTVYQLEEMIINNQNDNKCQLYMAAHIAYILNKIRNSKIDVKTNMYTYLITLIALVSRYMPHVNCREAIIEIIDSFNNDSTKLELNTKLSSFQSAIHNYKGASILKKTIETNIASNDILKCRDAAQVKKQLEKLLSSYPPQTPDIGKEGSGRVHYYFMKYNDQNKPGLYLSQQV